MQPTIRMCISDTGAGHRACAEALAAAIGDRAQIEIVDLMVASGTPGIAHMPAIYNWLCRHRPVWGAMWYALDGPVRARLLSDPAWLAAARTYTRVISEGDPDLVVVVHPYLTVGVRRSMDLAGATGAMATVVSDPVTPHASWFEPGAERVFVSTQAAWDKAVRCGVDPARLVLSGQPIHPRVASLPRQRAALRERYGWDGPVILLTGGGDGVGIEPCLDVLSAQEARTVVVCGRDEALRRRVEARGVEALGFVDDLPERMCAADLVLSKAGPSTLAECMAVGTPVLITSHMPGQEDGNLGWVTDAGAGEAAETHAKLAEAVPRWLANGARRQALRDRAAAQQASHALDIAEELLALVPRHHRRDSA